MTTFAQRLVLARTNRGLSQAQLAEHAETAPAQVSRYEAGKAIPRPLIVAKLAGALNVTLDWLMHGQGAPSFPMEVEPVSRPISVEVPARIRGLLEDAARESGRSIYDEAIVRLERSLSDKPVISGMGMKELFDRLDTLEKFIKGGGTPGQGNPFAGKPYDRG